MALRFSMDSPWLASVCWMRRHEMPASMSRRVSPTRTKAQLPLEPLPRIWRVMGAVITFSLGVYSGARKRWGEVVLGVLFCFFKGLDGVAQVAAHAGVTVFEGEETATAFGFSRVSPEHLEAARVTCGDDVGDDLFARVAGLGVAHLDAEATPILEIVHALGALEHLIGALSRRT